MTEAFKRGPVELYGGPHDGEWHPVLKGTAFFTVRDEDGTESMYVLHECTRGTQDHIAVYSPISDKHPEEL